LSGFSQPLQPHSGPHGSPDLRQEQRLESHPDLQLQRAVFEDRALRFLGIGAAPIYRAHLHERCGSYYNWPRNAPAPGLARRGEPQFQLS
jgi:hypothetical protein